MGRTEGRELDRKWKIAKAMIGRRADAGGGKEIVDEVRAERL